MKNKTNVLPVLACAGAAFLVILARYALSGGNPLNRLGYAIFISVVPALAALLVLRLSRLFKSRQRVALVYFVLLVLTIVFQAYARTDQVHGATTRERLSDDARRPQRQWL